MKHLAIIADGNRRWAKENSLPTKAGYLQGLTAIERCCAWAIENKVEYLTVFCFSTENWNRPKHEVDLLMNLARWYFDDRREWYMAYGIRVQFAGRRDRFDIDLINKMDMMESDTAGGTSITLTLCLDYGGRDEIARAISAGARTEKEINDYLTTNFPAPDAILRSGGEYRLSNFLLWQSAYSELFFTTTLFPAIEAPELDKMLCEYQKRNRSFGK